MAPELRGRGGQVVQVRYMPHDDRQVEVYLGDVHLCTAYPQGHLSDEQVAEFREHGKAETKRLTAARRRASRRSRVELAPLSDGQTAEAESRLVPDAAARAGRHRGDDALRRRSSASLLGLVAPYALPPGQSYPKPPIAEDGS